MGSGGGGGCGGGIMELSADDSNKTVIRLLKRNNEFDYN